ncbi:MAG: tRNA pseudouridine(55) synthase TruB [Erysipelotrichaceae bacterium]|nr:tRNA pseudouridine(55) synthase TruB [Erysipelotrichaceae bacterium]
MDAVILLNKPAGITSFDAVARCRRILHERKIGHTGTLDPNASGLLIILTGRYTKLLPYCVCNHKHYQAQFLLGKATETEDIWGNTIEENIPSEHTQEELDEVSRSLTGFSMQTPPMYSAIKVNGKKLYEYAREGKTIERTQREIHVDHLEVHRIEGNLYAMDAVVSSGTYIRTLITDYARKLNELGCMSALQRTGIDNLSLEQAMTFEQLETDPVFLRPEDVLNPDIRLIETDMPEYVKNGRDLKLDADSEYVGILSEGSLIAVYGKRENGYYHCERGLF